MFLLRRFGITGITQRHISFLYGDFHDCLSGAISALYSPSFLICFRYYWYFAYFAALRERWYFADYSFATVCSIASKAAHIVDSWAGHILVVFDVAAFTYFAELTALILLIYFIIIISPRWYGLAASFISDFSIWAIGLMNDAIAPTINIWSLPAQDLATIFHQHATFHFRFIFKVDICL